MFQRAGYYGRQPPTLGAGTAGKVVTTGTSLTISSIHTPAGTRCVVRFMARNNATTSMNAPTATFQGQAVAFTPLGVLFTSGTLNRAIIGIGRVTGLTPGAAGSLVVSCNRSMANLVARVDDISSWDGAFGDMDGSVYGSTAKNSHAASSVMQGAGRLLLGVGGGSSGSIDPLTASGWTIQSQDVTGTSATADVAAAFVTKTGGAIGATETLTVGGATTATDWGVALMEIA